MPDFKQIRDIIREAFPGYAEKITAATHFDNDIYADSLELITMAMRIENATGIAIEEADLEKIETVGQLEIFLTHESINQGKSHDSKKAR